MSLRKELFNCPAFRVVEAKGEYDYIKFGDTIAVRNGNFRDGMERWEKLRVFTIVGAAIDFGMCPFKEVERAKERGDKLFGLSKTTHCISNMKERQKVYRGFEVGDVVNLEGKKFEITRSRWGHYDLTEVEIEEVEA